MMGRPNTFRIRVTKEQRRRLLFLRALFAETGYKALDVAKPHQRHTLDTLLIKPSLPALTLLIRPAPKEVIELRSYAPKNHHGDVWKFLRNNQKYLAPCHWIRQLPKTQNQWEEFVDPKCVAEAQVLGLM